ncbi:MAG: DUF4215 domain-containing protein [Myxococcota bacterium]|nr:DUF4215 domain-containing protein [Myxococcota bacterium]
MIEGSETCDDGNRGADDGCSPSCHVECGDGTVGVAELCDTAIAAGETGACPTSCDDANACTTDTLAASECLAECVHGDITAAMDGDGCCPAGSDATSDDDCTAVCGNGSVEPTETCDSAIATGTAGACPATCDDAIACTADAMTGAGCTAACTNTEITAAMDGDGCCPAGATPSTDGDCAGCGDGTVVAPETCDTGIATGVGSCPMAASCNDGSVCTADALVAGGTCMAACTNTPIGAGPADGCCPTGATIATDADCAARCGDGAVTAPETCDDGGTASGDGCSATCTTEATPTAFRVSAMTLRDPHAFTSVFFSCLDITSNLNTQLGNAITMDGSDPDTTLDLSIVHVFRPLDQRDGRTTPGHITFPDCTAPMSSTMCTLPAGAMQTAADATNTAVGTCLAALPNTTTTGWDSPNTVMGPCYVSNIGDLTINLSSIPVILRQTSVAATYSGAPATQLISGLIRGFLTEADANATTIPGTVTLVGGMPLSAVLPGGAGCCRGSTTAGREMDTLADGTRGWWFYLNFTASVVPYSEL